MRVQFVNNQKRINSQIVKFCSRKPCGFSSGFFRIHYLCATPTYFSQACLKTTQNRGTSQNFSNTHTGSFIRNSTCCKTTKHRAGQHIIASCFQAAMGSYGLSVNSQQQWQLAGLIFQRGHMAIR